MLKRRGLLAFVVIAALLLVGTAVVSAAGVSKTIKVVLNQSSVQVNGKDVAIKGGTITYNGVVYAPVTEIASAMDAQTKAAKGKMNILTGAYRTLKYPSGEVVDVADLKPTSLLTSTDDVYTDKDGNSTSIFNTLKPGTNTLFIPLNKQFSILTFSSIGTGKYGSYVRVYNSTPDKKTAGTELVEAHVNPPTGKVNEVNVDVSGLDYILVVDSNKDVHSFNFMLTAK